MSVISEKLYQKYGLAEKPTKEQITKWELKTKKYINMGLDVELAGLASAIVLFVKSGEVNLNKKENSVVEILNIIYKYQ